MALDQFLHSYTRSMDNLIRVDRMILDEEEQAFLSSLFTGNNRRNFESDLNRLIRITKEIKQVHSQSLLLHGERINQARLILFRYNGGWLQWACRYYNNKMTAYNFMNFYLFYKQIEDEKLRTLFERIPRKVAYRLNTAMLSPQRKLEYIYRAEMESSNLLLKQIAQEEKKKTLGSTETPVCSDYPKVKTYIKKIIELLASDYTEEQASSIIDLLDQLQPLRSRLRGQLQQLRFI